MKILRNPLKLFNKPAEQIIHKVMSEDFTDKYYLEETVYGNTTCVYTIKKENRRYNTGNYFCIQLNNKQEAIQLCSLLNKWANFSATGITSKRTIPCDCSN